MNSSLFPKLRKTASALVITLSILVLITVIIVGYISGVMFETKTSRSALNQQKAHELATLAMHQAIVQLRNALGPWDDPFTNFMGTASKPGTPPSFFWSISPGRLTQWSFSSVTSSSNIALFSGNPTFSGSDNLVNLNTPCSDGSYPIIGGAAHPPVSVQWVNVLQNPSSAASATNQIIGRYAFWIDDENSKININTADGTNKDDPAKSLGVGTPTEVSLQVLSGTAAGNISGTTATNIVKIARTTGFHSVGELQRAQGITKDVLTSNVFNLTCTSRSPEINLFGEPKMYLIPAQPYLQSPGLSNYFFLANNTITERPLTEIYPTPSQLRGFPFNDSVKGISSVNTAPWNGIASSSSKAWPLCFEQQYATSDICNSANWYQPNFGGYNNALIAKYLSGVSGLDKTIHWPVFAGSSTAGFKGKYSLRQLDSISMQITDLSFKSTTPDDTYTSTECFPYSAPTTTWGYLSGQLVSGVGRFAKVNEILINAKAYSEVGTWPDSGSNYKAPYLFMSVYLKWFLPANFAGVDLLNYSPSTSGIAGTSSGNFRFGDTGRSNYLNLQDLPVSNSGGGGIAIPFTTGSPLPPNSFWHDTLLSNNAGIDFLANPGGSTTSPIADPDQTKAQKYHPNLYNTTQNKYTGSGVAATNNIADLLRMFDMSVGGANSFYTTPWYPGQYRCVSNQTPSSPYPMQPGTTSVNINGGLALLGICRAGRSSNPDPVPMDAMRAIYTGESYTALTRDPYHPSDTIQTRAMQSVIPVNITVPVPSTANGVWWHAEVIDPLVNKFPGDWITGTASSNAMGTLPGANSFTTTYNGVNNAALADPRYDPDSFWMPKIDPAIPRSARFPSIGYLQYLRTGIIPDDETEAYVNQHGTPYRLLNFAPSSDSSQKAGYIDTSKTQSQPYPDWAMLDLFTIPCTLFPYGGPYGYYKNGVWTAGSVMNGTPETMYSYGTHGGATSGRINPNGSVIYTTNVDNPAQDSSGKTISRTVPLQAMLNGVAVNQTLSTSTSGSSNWSGGSIIDTTEATTISQAISDYLAQNGPLREPAEICNIPAISHYLANKNQTRNDLVRQIVGNMTTQSNTFSVWVAGQSIQKTPSHTKYGEFETGDNVLSEIRYHFIVERYLDPGADGIYGNSSSAGNDHIAGTWDDLADPNNHPVNPRYLYRVIYSEEIR